MSPRILFAVAAVATTFFTADAAQQEAATPPVKSPSPTTEQPPAPAPAESQVTPEQVFETVGWIIAKRNNLDSFGMNPAEMAAFQKGLTSGASGQPPPETMEAAQAIVQQFLNARVTEHETRQAAGNKLEEQDFLAKLDANPEVKKTASGLRYEIIEPGPGPKPSATDTVVAHYTLTFVDGTVVESSRAGRGEPAEFALNAVIPAWTEGLQLIGTGGKIKLYVPSALGYGEHGSPGGIPPAKALVFDIELVDVKAAPVQLPGAENLPTLTP